MTEFDKEKADDKDYCLEFFNAQKEEPARHSFCHVSARLRDDHDVALAAMRVPGGGVDFRDKVGHSIRGDKEVVMAAISTHCWAFCGASEELRADKELALVSMHECGNSLEYASEALRDDEDVVRAAYEKDPYSIEYASKRLHDLVLGLEWGNKEWLFAEFLKERPGSSAAWWLRDFCLKELSAEQFADKEIVLALLGVEDRNGMLKIAAQVLEKASDELRNDLEVAEAALASPKLEEGAASYKLHTPIAAAFGALSQQLRANQEFVMKAVELGGAQVLQGLSEDVDMEFVVKILCQEHLEGWSRRMVPHFVWAALANDAEKLLAIITARGDYYVLEYASDELKNSFEFMMAAVMPTKGHCKEFASAELKENKEFVEACAALK